MSEIKETVQQEFWLFHEENIDELVELRKFMDPEIDLKSLEGITDIFDRLNHLLG
ncbi:MAG: hypothetical protein BAJATHORv1_10318 [Candidatus Thorarchaeota archaeon]|nr:MAG: hypothetical protein BAJATHORv1_10318 [Candidatus Thorarchaeota archaeon]